jgi:Leu/Phe-tRNA-protein transferase
MQLKYTTSGFIFISPQDDCKAIVDTMLATDYNEEFCLAVDFSPEFVTRLMEAGFLVMSTIIEVENGESYYLMLPKLHLERSALFFENLHIKKSIRKYLNRYELRADSDFDRIVDRCLQIHGEDWLTPPLVDCIKKIRQGEGGSGNSHVAPYPISFGLYRDGKLVAGEFGIVCGKIYTSYSGYYDEDNAGTVQIILTTRYLQENGFSFFDLGMPMDYKRDLGAVDISPGEFVRLFREGQIQDRS